MTALSGEHAVHVKKHLTICFGVMGVPESIKMDNGPSYISKSIQDFMVTWGIKHITGIPHNPTGQAIVERANQTLKRYIDHMKEEDPTEKLAKSLFVIS